jgi:antitoxin component of MazEF toxin-antitoxin module
MVELKIQKIGDALGLILPDEVLNRLKCVEGETLVLTEGPTGQYSLSQPPSDHEKIMAKAYDLMRRYEGTLSDLAK